MKALRLYGKHDLRYEDIPEPSIRPGYLKAKINIAAICGSDVKIYDYGPFAIENNVVPITMGHEFAGTVTEIGEGETEFKVGDRVTGLSYWYCGECFYCKKDLYNFCMHQEHLSGAVDGCMAEYMIAPCSSFFKLPDSVSDEAGAQVEPVSVALHAVRQGNVRPGDTVVVVGDGPIGLFTLIAARAAGAAEVYVVAKHKGRGEFARSLGANAVIYIDEGDPVQSIKHLTGGYGADVCIECVGQPHTPQLAVNMVRKKGTVVIVGLFLESSTFNFGIVNFDEITVVGSSCYVHEPKTAIAMMADGRIDPRRLITSKIPFKDAITLGFDKILADKEDIIKILLQVS